MIKGVGPVNAQVLNSVCLSTVGDFIDYWPRRYDDFSRVSKISQLRPGLVTIKGKFSSLRSRPSRKGLHITEALFSDETGTIPVIWFNQPYRASSIKLNSEYLLSGDFGLKARRLNITNPRIELSESDEISSGKILPIYRESKN